MKHRMNAKGMAIAVVVLTIAVFRLVAWASAGPEVPEDVKRATQQINPQRATAQSGLNQWDEIQNIQLQEKAGSSQSSTPIQIRMDQARIRYRNGARDNEEVAAVWLMRLQERIKRLKGVTGQPSEIDKDSHRIDPNSSSDGTTPKDMLVDPDEEPDLSTCHIPSQHTDLQPIEDYLSNAESLLDKYDSDETGDMASNLADRKYLAVDCEELAKDLQALASKAQATARKLRR